MTLARAVTVEEEVEQAEVEGARRVGGDGGTGARENRWKRVEVKE